jgi:hypothetical protein
MALSTGEGAGFQLGLEKANTSPVSPSPENPAPPRTTPHLSEPAKRFILNSHGLATEAFFPQGVDGLKPLNIEIIAGCDVQPHCVEDLHLDP